MFRLSRVVKNTTPTGIEATQIRCEKASHLICIIQGMPQTSRAKTNITTTKHPPNSSIKYSATESITSRVKPSSKPTVLTLSYIKVLYCMSLSTLRYVPVPAEMDERKRVIEAGVYLRRLAGNG